MSFADMKKNKNQLSKLIAAASDSGEQKTTKSYVDDRMWKPTVDKAGNGYAVIRFLPATDPKDLPWVRFFDHGFKGPTGQWYIEKSLTSIGQQDPLSEANSKLWNSGDERDKDLARERKRRLHYVSNIYVDSDPANPQNEGKVFLYTFGKKIFDKINDAMQPEFADEESINPFDFWDGASFKLKIRNVEGYRNYDKSEFASQTPLSESESELEEIFDSLYDLKEFTDPSSYKTYDELAGRLAMVLGETSTSVQAFRAVEEVAAPAAPKSAPAPAVGSEDEDTMSYFAKLAAED